MHSHVVIWGSDERLRIRNFNDLIASCNSVDTTILKLSKRIVDRCFSSGSKLIIDFVISFEYSTTRVRLSTRLSHGWKRERQRQRQRQGREERQR